MRLRYWFDCVFYSIVKTFLWFLLKTYFRVHYHGRENIPPNGPLLIACHHSSFLDPVLAGFGVPRIVSYLARDSLFRPPLKWLIEHLFTYPITRDSGDFGAIRTIQQLLRRNRAVLLFPEGTRSPDGRVCPFKPGIGLMAMRTQVPVLPVYIRGAFESWPRGKKLPSPARIQVVYGPILNPKSYCDLPRNREGFSQLTREIENRVKNLEKETIL